MTNPLKYIPDSNLAAEPGAADRTLRLIAKLPAPDGLADRVQAALESAPPKARLFSWPTRPLSGSWVHNSMARGAAAAAIVMVVVGGGWRVYSRVQTAPIPTGRVLVMPARIGNSGGFATAGAIHKPDTFEGPLINHPAVQPVAAAAATKSQTTSQPAPIAVPHKRKVSAKSKPGATKPAQ